MRHLRAFVGQTQLEEFPPPRVSRRQFNLIHPPKRELKALFLKFCYSYDLQITGLGRPFLFVTGMITDWTPLSPIIIAYIQCTNFAILLQ